MENKIILFLILSAIGKSKNTESNSLRDFLRGMTVDSRYTYDKINILKKVGPYFPEEYIPLINKSILIAEGYLKINDLSYLLNDDYRYIESSINIEKDRDRFGKIMQTIQKESPKFENNNLGMVMDLIINMDKYKSILSAFNALSSSNTSTKDPKQLINSLAPILGIDSKKDQGKMNELFSMLEIMDVLNSPSKKASPKE